MAKSNRRVVVISPVSTFYDSGWRTHVAAFAELGLAAFGDTSDVALARLKDSFRDFVEVHRENGVLEETLDGMGARWHWEDEYPADGPEYEDATKAHDPPEAVAVQQTRVEMVPPEPWTPAKDALAASANTDLAAVA